MKAEVFIVYIAIATILITASRPGVLARRPRPELCGTLIGIPSYVNKKFCGNNKSLSRKELGWGKLTLS